MELHFILFPIVLHFLSIIINALGLYCLYKQKRNGQNIILSNLSSIKILISLVQLIFNAMSYTGYYLHVKPTSILGHGFSLSLYLIMCFISIDRLLCILLHTRYKYYITKTVIIKVHAFIWILPMLFSTTLYLIDESRARTVLSICIYPVLDALFVIIAVFTYSLIICKVNKSKKDSRRSQTNASNKNECKKYLIPGLIILSFVSFYAIPDFIFALRLNKDWWSYYILGCIWNTSFIVEPFIYIFLSKPTRRQLHKLFCGNGPTLMREELRHSESAVAAT